MPISSRVSALIVLAAACFAVPVRADGPPPEGAIWDYHGTDFFGDPFQNTLMVHHGDLLLVLPKGEQLDLGPIKLNAYNEYEVPAQYFQQEWPDITSMTFKFSADFSSVTETELMHYHGDCAAGNCANNVETSTYTLRQ